MRCTTRSLVVLGLAGCVLLIGKAAWADFKITQTESVALSTTDWTRNLVFNKFDPSQGTLTEVDFSLTGNVVGSAQFENTSGASATIKMQLRADLKLVRPDNSVIITTIPIANTSDTVGAYDGVTDFAGSSGRSYTNLSASLTNTGFTTTGSDLALFAGPGTVTLPLSATGTSFASGAGSLVAVFNTQAAGSATITYTFTPVPEPSSLFLTAMGGGAVLVGLFRHRKKILFH